MRAERIVCITRRFWPLVGGAESAMANLSAGFREAGREVTLLTARWQPGWPAEIVHRGVRVVRLRQSPLRGWGTWQYMRGLARWLRRHAEEFDLVYVSMLKHDAYAALGALGDRKPIVLRAEGAGLTGDVHWQLDARFGRRIKQRCYRAAALVAPSRAIERELIAGGFNRGRIHYLPNGTTPVVQATAASRQAARNALAEAHPALALPREAKLALYTGRLHEAKGLAELVDAWTVVVERFPEARLWLAGEGPMAEALAQKIGAAGLDGRVVLAGTFDSVDELLAAADLFVLPSWEEGMSIALLEAMAAGLPIVASDIPGNRDLLTGPDCAWFAQSRQTAELGRALIEAFSSPARAAEKGSAARNRATTHFDLAKIVGDHLELFDTLPRGTR